MPTTESYLHSQAEFDRFVTPDGRCVYVSNGSVVETSTGKTLADSSQSADWVLANCKLTAEWRERVNNEKRYCWPTSGDERRGWRPTFMNQKA